MAIVLTAVAVLALLAPAAESQQQTEQEMVVEGSALELLCVNGINMIWTFNGTPIDFQDGIACGGYCNRSSESLVLRAVLRQHQGLYACLLAEVTYLVTVIVPPVVVLEGPSELTLHAGASLNLTYSLVEGGPVTAVRWYKNTETLLIGGRVSVLGQSLRVGAVEQEDAGEYLVEVDNEAGTGSAVVTVSIMFPPEVAPIVPMPTSLVTPTSNVTLVCSIVANPQVTSVEWTSAVEGGTASTVPEASQMSESGQYGQFTTTSTIVVQARGMEEQYMYTCVGRNALGEGQASIMVHEGVIPPAPTGVRVSTVTSTSLTLYWDTPFESSLVEVYVIEQRNVPGTWSEVGTTPGDRYFAMLQQLTPNTQYELRVVARNQVGSRASESVTISTTHLAPSLPPNTVTAVWNQMGSSVDLTWMYPSGPVVEGYSVTVSPTGNVAAQAVNVSTPYVSLTSLVRGTSYSIAVAAYNNGGLGPAASISFTVPPVRVAPEVSVVRLTTLSFSIFWTPPTDANELLQYNVTVTESIGTGQWTAVVDKTGRSQCYRGLDSSKVYRVTLNTVYVDGSYVQSEEQVIPSEGGGSGGGDDDGCLEIIPITGLPTAPPSVDMTAVIAVVVVVGVALLALAISVSAAIAMFRCVRQRSSLQSRQVDLESSSSVSNSRMTTAGSSPIPPDSPQLKSILVYNSAKETAKLQYYDVDSIFGTLSDHDKARSQIVGFEV